MEVACPVQTHNLCSSQEDGEGGVDARVARSRASGAAV
jgi:hypothetical protein